MLPFADGIFRLGQAVYDNRTVIDHIVGVHHQYRRAQQRHAAQAADRGGREEHKRRHRETLRHLKVPRFSIMPIRFNRRHSQGTPNEIIISNSWHIKGTVNMANAGAVESTWQWGANDPTQSWIADKGDATPIKGRFFLFNMNSVQFPIAYLPSSCIIVGGRMSDYHLGSGWNDVKGDYFYYRLEEQTIKVTFWTESPAEVGVDASEASISNDINVLAHRRFMSKKSEPYNPLEPTVLVDWPADLGLTEESLNRDTDFKSATIVKLGITGVQTTNRKKYTNFTFRYNRAAAAQEHQRQENLGGPADPTDWKDNFTRWHSTTGNPSGVYTDPLYYDVVQIAHKTIDDLGTYQGLAGPKGSPFLGTRLWFKIQVRQKIALVHKVAVLGTKITGGAAGP